MANESLKTIYSWSHTANSMITISLMYDAEQKFNKHFVFFNIVPGVNSDSGRTFDFKKAVTFKLVPSKLSEIAHALPIMCRGQQKMIGAFGIMVDSSKSNSGSGGGGKKTMFFNYNPPGDKAPSISIVAKGNESVNIFLPVPTALMLADVCTKIFNTYLDLDIKNYVPYTRNGDADQNRGRDFNGGGNRNNSSSQRNSNYSEPNFGNDDQSFSGGDDEVPF